MVNASVIPPSPVLPVLPATPRPWDRLRWAIHLILIGAYPLVIGLMAAGDTHSREPALGSGAQALFIICLVELGVFGIVFFFAWLASRVNLDQLLLRWRGPLAIPLGIGYSVAVRVLLAILVGFVAGILISTHLMTVDSLKKFFEANRPNVDALVDVSALKHNPLYFWLSITLVSFVVGGFREELWRSSFLAGTKALFPRHFGSVRGQVVAAFLAAIVFGLGHLLQGPLAVCLTGLLGFMLGLIMIFHRSIWPAVIAHGLFDATSLALLPWVVEKLKTN